MLAVVKKRHTKKQLFKVSGEIPEKLLKQLEKEYGKDLEMIEDEDEEYVNFFETDFYKDINAKTTTGDAMKIYRENFGLTQAQLGEKLGGFSRQYIADLEKGRRGISKKNAKKLSKIFNRPVYYFL